MPLSSEQLKALDLLLCLPTLTAVAEGAGVDRGTLRRWLKDPDFLAELRTAQRLVINQNMRGIASMAGKAIRTIESLMDGASDEKVRLDAAREAFSRLFDVDLVMRTNELDSGTEVPGAG